MTGAPLPPALARALSGIGPAALAVSGGVDSMTLAHAAMRAGTAPLIFHAVSPAVPDHATARVHAHAAAHGWELTVLGAGEFDDPDYLRNPLNRCYFCKSNLYDRLRAETDRPICSGTNTDDLGDFRPGLGAARERAVRHPFVDAGMDKTAVRALARALGLDDLAELPAQPCLSSRVETGLPIVADDLALIDRVEILVARELGPGDIRARVTRSGLWLELPEALLGRMTAALSAEIYIAAEAAGHRFRGARPYVRGAAFVGAKHPAGAP